MDDMNDFRSWAQDSRFYEQLLTMDDINDVVLWAQGSRCYEQFKVVDDMNDLGSYKLRPLDVMNNSWL